MQKKFILAVLLLVASLLISACDVLENLAEQSTGGSPTAATTIGETLTVSGTVVDTINDCIVDGICAYVVESEGVRYDIIWAEGMLRCEGEYTELSIGDSVTAFGEVINESGGVSICRSDKYYVRGA